MSQEAYAKYEEEVKADGLLIFDADLVHPEKRKGKVRELSIPATRFAEELGNRIIANVVMLGFFTAVTDVVSERAMKKAIPGFVPSRFVELNMKAFQKGYEYGKEVLRS